MLIYEGQSRIRPLHYEELAARQVTGRHQIAADGTHLIDGIPFGKRYLKRAPSSRPPVHIPPRNKRRRINEDGWDGNTSLIGNFAAASPGPAEIVRRSICDSSAQLEEHENADDQGSQQLIEIGHAGTETQPAGILGSPFPGSTTPPNVVDRPKSVLSVKDVKKTPRKYCVQKPRVQERHQSVLSSSSSGTDSAPSVRGVRESLQEACDETPRADDTKRSIISSSSSESSESSTSEDESSSDSEHSDEEDIEQASRDVHDDSSSTSSTSVSSSDISSSLSSSPSSNGTSSDSDVSKNKQRKPTPKTDTTGVKSNKSSVLNPPGLGSRRTRHSNLRTKLRKRLAKLKAAGVLPASANFEDLRAWDQSSAQRIAPKTEGPGLEKDENLSFKKAEFEERRAQLLRDIDAGGIDVTPKTGQLESQIVDGGNVAESPAEPISTTELPKRGKKLDLASARRFVFGSLGLRTPKSKQDVEEAKAKLAHRLKRLEPNDKEDKEEATKQLKETTTIRQALMPVENWGDFIVVKATECIYEDVKMPPPPFPFVQRWDAKSQQQIRERRNQQNPQRKKRKRKSRAYEDEGWEGHMNYERALLVYSDKEENMENVPTPAPRSTTELPGSVCEPVGVAVVEATPSQEEDGLPLLENVSSLPDATLEHMKPGAIIAFKQLEVSKTTGWEPTISAYRTGVVEQLFEDSTINIRLAKRDREHREENGESDTREYSGFDMPGYDDEQREDDGFRELELYQLMEPKLVRAAPVEHSEKNVVQATLIEDSEEVMVEETQNNGLSV